MKPIIRLLEYIVLASLTLISTRMLDQNDQSMPEPVKVIVRILGVGEPQLGNSDAGMNL